jgi:hypothetical protein
MRPFQHQHALKSLRAAHSTRLERHRSHPTMQPPPHASALPAPLPCDSGSPSSSSRLAPVASAISGILATQPSSGSSPDARAISRQIVAALESVELASPLAPSGYSPSAFVMRMPPSDRQLKAIAAIHQKEDRPRRQPTPVDDLSFAFDHVPSLADFDLRAIASDASLHAKS